MPDLDFLSNLTYCNPLTDENPYHENSPLNSSNLTKSLNNLNHYFLIILLAVIYIVIRIINIYFVKTR
jgi:hypothetical protein